VTVERRTWFNCSLAPFTFRLLTDVWIDKKSVQIVLLDAAGGQQLDYCDMAKSVDVCQNVGFCCLEDFSM
jgi:hypothetical protein